MPAWLHGLSLFWLVAFVFGVAVLVTAAIYAVVISLSTGERGRAFASVSPGLLPPMGIIFALVVGFWPRRSGVQESVVRARSARRRARCVRLCCCPPSFRVKRRRRCAASFAVTSRTRS